jgi:hypothetical protein
VKQKKSVEYLAECFWSGVTDRDLAALDQRAEAASATLTSRGEHVRYLGSILLRQDEVVLCRFKGAESAVRRVAEEAGIPFDRILEAARSPWHADPPTEQPSL